MDFTVGGISSRGTLAERAMLSYLRLTLVGEVGICSFRFPPVGNSNLDAIPSFTIYGPNVGLILLDVVNDEIMVEQSGVEYWTSSQGDVFLSRDLIIDQYVSEIKTRVRSDYRLVDRKQDNFRFSVRKILAFARNSSAELEALTQKVEFISETVSVAAELSQVRQYIEPVENRLSEDAFNSLVSMLESTSGFKRQTQLSSQSSILASKSDFIRRAMDVVFKLDDEQRRISWQMPDGPQRIRGLAGTGKTVILSLKAAYAHQAFPTNSILVTFHTQSLYHQFESLISKYYAREARSTPDWSRLRIMHAWGSQERNGVYRDLCERYGLKPLGLREVPRGMNALGYIYRDLLLKIRDRIEPLYDLILIDEAQDLPAPVFETLYHLCKEPKRIVWAYDEFQSLTDVNIREPSSLFGHNALGKPNIADEDLRGEYADGVQKDFVLKNSYRNPRRILTSAHGLALGLYRKAGPIEMLPNASSWRALGYDVDEPQKEENFAEGDHVRVHRPEAFSLNTLEVLLRENRGANADRELISHRAFANSEDEDEFIVSEIERLINEEGILPEQILVISLGFKTLQADLLRIRQLLTSKGVASIAPGIIESPNLFAVPGSVTLCSPLRAKGNEVHVVFVTRAERATEDKLFRARNAIFVALTRAQGWCYVSGHGEGMTLLQEELSKLDRDYPELKFRVPNEALIKLRRDIISGEESQLRERNDLLTEIMRENPGLLVERIAQMPELVQLINKQADVETDDL